MRAPWGLAQWLEREGWNEYFLDVEEEQGIAPGERWQAALKAAVDRSPSRSNGSMSNMAVTAS